MTNHEPKHPTADMAGLDGLIERLRSVDVSWSETGEWCAEAADQLQALAQRVKVLEEALREISTPRVGGGDWAAQIARAALKGTEQ